MEERERRRHVGRGLVAAFCWTVVALLCLLLSALFHLDSDAGRAVVARVAVDVANGLIAGELEISRVDVLTLSRIEVSGVTLRSPDGQEVASVERLGVSLDPWALIGGEVHLEDVVVTGPKVFVGSREGGEELALLEAVALVDPGPEDDEPSEPIPVTIDALSIVDAEVDGLGDGLSVRGGSVAARVTYDETLRLDVSSASAELTRDDRVLAALDDLTARVDLSPGARSEAALRVESGEDHAELEAAIEWTEDGPGALEAELRFEVSPALAQTLGAGELEGVVDGRVAGTLRASGTLDDIEAQGALETEGGRVEIAAARHGEEVSARVATDGLSLGDVVPSLGQSSASGAVEATLSPLSGPDRVVDVTARDVSYDEWSVPEARVRATLAEDGTIRVDGVEIPHLTEDGGHLVVEAAVTPDGAVDAHVDARIVQIARDENLRRIAPGVRGGVSADIDARISGGESPTIDVSGRVRADGFRAPGGVSARRLVVRGSARGPLDSPVLDVSVEGSAIQAGGITVRDASLRVTGGPRRYRADGSVRLASGERLDVDGTAEMRGGEYYADATLLVRGYWPDPVRVVLRRMHLVPDRYVSFESLSAESTGLSVSASGRYGLSGDSDLSARVAELDLEKLGQALGSPILTGSARGEARFGGTTRAPELTVRASLADVTAGPFEVPSVEIAADLSSDRGEVSASVDADAAGYGRIDLQGRGALGAGRDVETRLRAGTYDVNLALADVPATVISLASPDLPPFDGTIDLVASLTGTTDDPTLSAEIDVDDFAGPGISPLAVDVRAGYTAGRATVTVGASDVDGVVATARAEAPIDLPALARGEPFDPLSSDLSLDLSVPNRPLDRFPEPLRVPISAHASAEVALRRTDGVTRMQADGRIERFEDALAEAGCTPGPMPAASYRILLEDGHTDVDIAANIGGTHVGDVHAEATTPVDAWLRDGLPEELPAVSANASLERVDLSRIPVVCGVASGLATVHLNATDLLRPDPRMDLDGAIEGLTVEDTAPVDLLLAGGLSTEGASVDVKMQDGGRDVLVLTANAPVTMGPDGLSPALRDEPFRAELRLDRAPAAPILAPLPLIAQPRGVLDGGISLTGTSAEDATASGEIELQDLSFIITEPIVRVDRLNGAIGFQDGDVVLRGLTMRDRDGSLAADGRIGLEGLTPRSVGMELELDRWPLRNEGVPFAYANAEIVVDGELGDEGREIRATFDDFNIRLPEEAGHVVQSLDQHPDVIYEDQPGFARDGAVDAEAADESAEEEDVVETRIIIDATQPFWIRRDDFAIQLTADLRLTSDASGVRITGPVEVKRGYLEIVGRSFDFDEGEIIFDGGSEVDPTLDLTAIHTLKSRETVTVRITGRLSRPDIQFSTTVADAQTDAQIIDLLVSGHGNTAMDARDQAASVIGSMAAGLLSSMTRKAAGDFIPRLSIEGGGAGSTRIRAGLSADALIPDFLDDIVQSAYIEGFVGTSEEQTSASGETSETGAQGGFLIELYWPRSIVTTGTYEQPSNWSLDVTWEP